MSSLSLKRTDIHPCYRTGARRFDAATSGASALIEERRILRDVCLSGFPSSVQGRSVHSINTNRCESCTNIETNISQSASSPPLRPPTPKANPPLQKGGGPATRSGGFQRIEAYREVHITKRSVRKKKKKNRGKKWGKKWWKDRGAERYSSENRARRAAVAQG